ncbi:unnamed protein product (macronuclear) [Paramecium tetraurelia]|uniref:Thioredoxin reductase n=1 Tax=Paramecium tetraurelia TaxID=5888 RepID=A0CQA5_PARTE|nr:uncharacterized protein GSPATT00009320001 [Paramecium tetraurelia]CAK72972.1 unnamed protein product [Paramecium tetraurelia]|eukprot:XP_001440369.1 hypothetical protein (macronuclear) [Paramecium tetraurelia strain d4-2]
MLKKLQYDLFVIGGGAGGLASSKASALLGKKVGIADYATPSPHATTWGTGGTCVNVGCVPTKLMPFSAKMGEIRKDQIAAGYQGVESEGKHNWKQLIETVQKHIKELNVRQESSLKDHGIDYYNKFAKFIDRHTIELTDVKGEKEIISAKNIIVCVGSRPMLYQDPKLVITSEDVFQQTTPPGKTLVIGASYVGLECAGFIHGFGFDTTVLVRTRVMRNFDQEMASKVEGYMSDGGIKFVKRALLQSISAVDNGKRRLVKWVRDGVVEEDIYDTVLYGIGRQASTKQLNLESIGVKIDARNYKIMADEYDRTTVDNIYEIGDCCLKRQEYTPIEVMDGRKLDKRMYGDSNEIMDYDDVDTNIQTTIEYGSIGLQEERAKKKYGDDGKKIKRTKTKTKKWRIRQRDDEKYCGGKLIVHKESERIIGYHTLDLKLLRQLKAQQWL